MNIPNKQLQTVRLLTQSTHWWRQRWSKTEKQHEWVGTLSGTIQIEHVHTKPICWHTPRSYWDATDDRDLWAHVYSPFCSIKWRHLNGKIPKWRGHTSAVGILISVSRMRLPKPTSLIGLGKREVSCQQNTWIFSQHDSRNAETRYQAEALVAAITLTATQTCSIHSFFIPRLYNFPTFGFSPPSFVLSRFIQYISAIGSDNNSANSLYSHHNTQCTPQSGSQPPHHQNSILQCTHSNASRPACSHTLAVDSAQTEDALIPSLFSVNYRNTTTQAN